MSSNPNTRMRRALLLGGVLAACVGLVESKASTASPSRRVALGPTTTAPAAPAPTATAAAPTTPGTAAPRSTAGATAPPKTRATTAAPSATRTVVGSAVNIYYGMLQVQITVRGTRIVDVTTLQLPTDGRSQGIAAYAVPILRAEVLAAQSAQINTVSGASYTSQGYAQSVQSAIDAAKL